MPVKVINEVHDLVVSQFAFVFVLVTMGLSLSLLQMGLLKANFSKLPGSNLEKSKQLPVEVFSEINWTTLVVFLRFAKQLGLTEGEWGLLFYFRFPTLSQIRE